MNETIAKSLASEFYATREEILAAYCHARREGYTDFMAWKAVKTWLCECRRTRRPWDA
jgi:hypothetical protein